VVACHFRNSGANLLFVVDYQLMKTRIENCRITDRAASVLEKALGGCTLQSLLYVVVFFLNERGPQKNSLCGNRITDFGIIALANGLKVNTKVNTKLQMLMYDSVFFSCGAGF
jgi:hypothetical protein